MKYFGNNYIVINNYDLDKVFVRKSECLLEITPHTTTHLKLLKKVLVWPKGLTDILFNADLDGLSEDDDVNINSYCKKDCKTHFLHYRY
ncbi:hypothetical protein TNIN_408391 [Trichonephila inaurata madagascariensis]|uniref:Uncharacterized protein n=1 Tax=Trichonephila inaurata madagascariensis TaxID=2747483 RepID=A0A8X6WR77_9ARAC|nr:hypothetical protein TNIN_408391 [Trichonephila inaurata madagascariensis]